MISDETLTLYLDGEASAAEVRDVEAALDADPALVARLDALSRQDREVKAAFDGLLDQPVPEHLVRLARGTPQANGPRLVVENISQIRPAAPRGEGRGLTGALRRTWRGTPRWVGYAAAAQIGLLLLAVAVLQPNRQDAAYHALGAAPEPASANLMVMFRPETPEGRLRGALTSVDATIVGGPTATGAYILHVPSGARASAVSALRRRPDILLAEPIDSGRNP